MQIIAKRVLVQFWDVHPMAKVPLQQWYAVGRAAHWGGPADVKAQFRSADFIADNRVIFDIGGNRYRFVCRVVYRYRAVQLKFVGTHAEYDRIDPRTVG